MNRADLVAYLDDFLLVKTIEDRSSNGLQVEGAAEITCLAFAVDAGLAAFEGARAAGAQMLIVHHGLFWDSPLMVTGIHRRRLKLLLEADLSLYASHLPLDFHDTVGNNAVLARWLDLKNVVPFGEYKGLPAGVAGGLPAALSLDQFAALVEQSLGAPVSRVWPFGSSMVRRVGIVSGGAGFLVDQAAQAGVAKPPPPVAQHQGHEQHVGGDGEEAALGEAQHEQGRRRRRAIGPGQRPVVQPPVQVPPRHRPDGTHLRAAVAAERCVRADAHATARAGKLTWRLVADRTLPYGWP